MSYPVLQRAPIVEALLDIRIAPELPDVLQLQPFEVAIKDAFSKRNEIREWTGTVDLSANSAATPVTPSVNLKGVALSSHDGRRVVQARTNGFSLSHLRPYGDWPTLRAEAQPLWKSYAEVAKPAQVVRLGLRYINRLELPAGADLKQFLRVAVEIAPDLPQSLNSFFMQFSLSFGEVTALITQMVDTTAITAEKVAFILDIDVYRTVSLSPEAAELWECCEDLRHVKNDVFFKSLTPAALEMLK